jgi:hypothetical protein
MKYLVFLVINLLIATFVFAQPTPNTLWTRTYGGSGEEWATTVQLTTDGGYVIVGHTTSYGAGGYDLYVVKTNSQGNPVWTHTYGGAGNESANSANSIRQTMDGGYIIVGYTNSYGAGGYDFYVVKTNSQGDTLWTRTYGGNRDEGGLLGGEFFGSIQQTADSGYVIAGNTNSFGVGGSDFYVIKTNSQGDTLWTHTYGGSLNDGAFSIQQTTDRGYIVAGTTRSFGAGGTDFYVVKTDSNGVVQWARTYGGSNDDQGNFVLQTTDGGYLVAGYTYSFGVALYDVYIVKTDATGNVLWTRTYGGSNGDGILSLDQTIDGGYVLAGWTYSFGAGNQDFYVLKTNGQGNLQWSRTYGGSNEDYAMSVRSEQNGGFIIAGNTASFGAGGHDFFVVKTGPDSLCVTPLTPQVVITTVGEDAHLNWQPVTQSVGGCPITVTRYLVFYSLTSDGPYYYHGYSTGTSYVHLGVISYASGMFYQVRSFVGAPALVDGIERGTSLEEVMDKLQTNN